MRKFVIAFLGAASALAVAAPASAQWAHPGYSNAPYNYGAFNDHRFAGEMNSRVERIRRDVRQMAFRRVLSWGEARSLEGEAANLQRRIYFESRNGIQPGEARRLEDGIRRLEYRVSREATDWNDHRGYRRD